MPEEIELLRKRIEAGVEAAEQMRQILQEQEQGARGERKKRFRLIKGGAVGAALWGGVEWLTGSKAAVVLAAAAVAVAGGVIVEHPGTSGADPPAHSIIAPEPKPSVPPTSPRAAPTPRRTSPPRTRAPARVAPPTQPVSSKPVKPTVEPTKAKPTRTTVPPAPSKQKPRPIVSTPVLPTVTPSVPTVIETTPGCTGIGLLGLCILGN